MAGYLPRKTDIPYRTNRYQLKMYSVGTRFFVFSQKFLTRRKNKTKSGNCPIFISYYLRANNIRSGILWIFEQQSPHLQTLMMSRLFNHFIQIS